MALNEALGHSVQQEVLDKIRLYEFKHKHLSMLLEMLVDQGHPLDHINMRTLPRIGYIAMLDNIPIAAGFLRRVEGDVVAQIDGLTSNPHFGSIIRHHGIEQVLNTLLEDAKRLNLKGVYAFCLDPSAIARANKMGFKAVDHTTLALILE